MAKKSAMKKTAPQKKHTAATENPLLEFAAEVRKINSDVHKQQSKVADLTSGLKQAKLQLAALMELLDRTIVDDTAPLFKQDGGVTRPQTKRGEQFAVGVVGLTGAVLEKANSNDLIRPSKTADGSQLWGGGRISKPVQPKGDRFAGRSYTVINVLGEVMRGMAAELLPLYTIDEWRALGLKSHDAAADKPYEGTVVAYRGNKFVIGPDSEGIVIEWK